LNAYQLLTELLAMVESTDFSRCSAARGFRGRFDVWLNRNQQSLMFIEHEHDRQQRVDDPPLHVTGETFLTAQQDGRTLCPIEEYLQDVTE
jgi:hypothetical protein